MQSKAFASKRKSNNIRRIFVIIPAAGKSERMGEDKLFIEIAGKPVIQRTLEAFGRFAKDLEKSDISVKVVVVTSTSNNYHIHKLVKNNNYSFVHSVIIGGSSRTESVWKGLEELDNMPIPPTDDDIVFIHDGARCLVSDEVLDNCLEGIMYNDICAAAVPAKNTIKKIAPVEKAEPLETDNLQADAAVKEDPKDERPAPAIAQQESHFAPLPNAKKDEVQSPFAPLPKETAAAGRPGAFKPRGFNGYINGNKSDISEHPSKFKRPVGFDKSAILFNPNPKPVTEIKVESTPKRDELMEVQTPQCFRYLKLINSYANAIRNGITGTDDTELAEKLNYKVTLVEGSYSNIKITTPEDIAMAEAIVKEQEKKAEG